MHLRYLTNGLLDHKFDLLDLTTRLKTAQVFLPLSVEEVLLVVGGYPRMQSYLLGLVAFFRVFVEEMKDEVFGRTGYVLPLSLWELYPSLLDLLEELLLVVTLKGRFSAETKYQGIFYRM